MAHSSERRVCLSRTAMESLRQPAEEVRIGWMMDGDEQDRVYSLIVDQ